MKVSLLKVTINCYDHLKIVKTISQQMVEPFSMEMYYSTSRSVWKALTLDC